MLNVIKLTQHIKRLAPTATFSSNPKGITVNISGREMLIDYNELVATAIENEIDKRVKELTA